MAPTIPAGRAARAAWRRLDRRTKAEVLRRATRDQGHPDPRVAAVAVGFARWERAYPRWVGVAVVLGLVLVGALVDWLSRTLPVVTATALAVAVILWRARRATPRQLERMERANLAVLTGEGPAPSP